VTRVASTVTLAKPDCQVKKIEELAKSVSASIFHDYPVEIQVGLSCRF